MQGGADFIIRRMEARDISAVALLAGQLGYPSLPDEIRSRWNRLSGVDHEFVFVLEACDGSIFGFAHLGEEYSLTSEPRMFLRSLVISESCRGQNLGKKLLDHLEGFSRARGFRRLRVGSEISRKAAHRFYLRNNYAALKISQIFEKDFSTLDP